MKEYEYAGRRSGGLREVDIILGSDLRALHMGVVETEYRFHTKRKWRFDYSIPSQMLACEVEGGTFVGGRHTRGSGFQKDCDKYNYASSMGWTVLRFTTQDIRQGNHRIVLNDWKNYKKEPEGGE